MPRVQHYFNCSITLAGQDIPVQVASKNNTGKKIREEGINSVREDQLVEYCPVGCIAAAKTQNILLDELERTQRPFGCHSSFQCTESLKGVFRWGDDGVSIISPGFLIILIGNTELPASSSSRF